MLAITFGAVSMVLADSPLAWLAGLFAVYAAADGAVAAAGALRDAASRIPWGSLTRGLFGIMAGYMVMQVPTSHPIGFHALLTAWALVTGVFEIVAGLHGYRRLDGDIYQILHGVVTVFLGTVLLLIPPTGLHAFFPLISLNIAMAGALLLLLGLRTEAARSDS
jgi:uncharacterized membrane protein HdeD (DUF308 family)